MEVAGAMVASGLKAAGYSYVDMDGAWAVGRDPLTGAPLPDPYQFPMANGIKPVADYIHSRGLLFGLYTDRGSANCAGRQTGSGGHEEQVRPHSTQPLL